MAEQDEAAIAAAKEAEAKAVLDKAAQDAIEGKNAMDNDAETGTGNEAPADDTQRPEDDKEDKTSEGEEGEGKDQDEGDEQEREDDVEGKALDTDVWGSTGDEVGDSVLQMLQNAEMSPDDAKALMYDAVKAGDPSKIDKEALIEKVGKAKANLIMAGVENFVTKNAANTAAIVATVHEAVGGKENWEKVTPWANEHMDKELLADYVEMIDAGGAKAKFASQEMLNAYNSFKGNTSLTGVTIEGDSANNKTEVTETMTRAQATEAKIIAMRNGDHEEVARIQRIRRASRAKGI